MTDERLKLWLNFWKFILSSVVISGGIAIATTVITAKEKSTQLEIQVNQQEQEYLTSFLEKAMDDNLEKRRRFAQYFAALTTPGPFKDGWTKYLEAVEEEVDKTAKRVDELEKNIGGKKGLELAQAKEELKELRSELRSRKARGGNKLTYLKPVPFDKITNEELVCPQNTTKFIWSERVWISSIIPEFPDDYFVTLGCRNAKGNKEGGWISWYSSGVPIQQGILTDQKNMTFTSWYENGQKAHEVRRVNGVDQMSLYWFSNGVPVL